jgi:iron complex transport system ATP-binding protein
MSTQIAPAKTHALQCTGISFRHDQRLLLQELSFTLAPGSCTALIGPNGIGKTTLLRILTGLVPCDSGEIWLAGLRLSTLSRREIATRIALVPQHLEIPFDFSVEQIVAQGRHPHRRLLQGLSTQDRAAVEEALLATNTTSVRKRNFNQLSGGERQRVKIALGLAQQPQLLLLDEPTQNLDIGRQVELLSLIRSVTRNGITILAAMHDLPLIEGTFSSVILLSPYGPMLQGTPSEVLQPPILERAFDCPPHHQPNLTQDGTKVRNAAV